MARDGLFCNQRETLIQNYRSIRLTIVLKCKYVGDFKSCVIEGWELFRVRGGGFELVEMPPDSVASCGFLMLFYFGRSAEWKEYLLG